MKTRKRVLKHTYQSNHYYRLNYSKTLQVEVLLYKNWAVLYTQRVTVQTIDTLLSNISGSICGILGILGYFMGLYEENYINYIRKRKHILDIRKCFENRGRILMKNFGILNLASEYIIPRINEGRISFQTSFNESRVYDISNITNLYTISNYGKEHTLSKRSSRIEVEDLE